MCTATMTVYAQTELSVEDSSAIDRTPTKIILIEVTLDDEDPRIRKMALERVTDRSVFKQIALNDKDPEVRKLALARITDQ